MYNSNTYYAMINWQTVKLTEPPVTKGIPDLTIEEFVKTGNKPVGLIPAFPCHSQAVERQIKLVTEASASVCGADDRDGFIRSRLHSRLNIPRFNSKKDFQL